jgi:hypothetical protein
MANWSYTDWSVGQPTVFFIKVDSAALISRDCQHTKQIALNLDHCWKRTGRAGELKASTCIICTLAPWILLAISNFGSNINNTKYSFGYGN